MERDIIFIIISIEIVLFTVLLGYGIHLMDYKTNSLNTKLNDIRFRLVSLEFSDSVKNNSISGIYFPGVGYCVKTVGHNDDYNEDTECHEKFHNYIYNDYEEFCE